MTTILYNPLTRELAADGQTTDYGVAIDTAKDKIFTFQNYVIAFAGNVGDIITIKEAMLKQQTTEAVKVSEKRIEIDAIRMDLATGKADYLAISSDQSLKWESLTRECGFGSGGQLGVVALRAGATTQRAMEIACEIDAYSGGKITIVGASLKSD